MTEVIKWHVLRSLGRLDGFGVEIVRRNWMVGLGVKQHTWASVSRVHGRPE